MLELINLNSFYGGAQILFDVNLKVKREQVVALFGRNGAGKTTTFRSIMGMAPPLCKGAIQYLDENLLGLPSYKIAQKGIGFVPEDRKIFPNIDVRKNLIVGRKKSINGQSKWDLDEVYAFFPKLKQMERNLGSQMSGGEQQMLTVARTLMGNPDLILLDEPTEGLAPIIAKDLMEMILRIKKEFGISILLVEQFSTHILDYLDYCYVMEMGRIVYSGDPMRLKEDCELQQQYLGVG